MDTIKWKTYGFWIGLSELVGLISGLLARKGIEVYSVEAVKPPLTPPQWVFPVVWTVLFALMGIAAARYSLATEGKGRGVTLFLAQLVVNFFWPLFFFNLQKYGFALFWLVLLWLLVLGTILAFYRENKLAAWLLMPYLAWLTFAFYLNAGVYLLN